MSYLAINKPEEAIKLLEPLSKINMLEGKNKGFNEMARWYLALSYIKINEDENAVNALNSIIDNSSSNYKKDAATEVLGFLD